MLDPEYLNSLPEPLLALYDELEDRIIGDIARRLKKYGEVTATAEHQTEILRALDLTQNEINEKIAETLKKSIEEIERLFDEAMQKSSAYTQERFPSLPTDGSFKKQLLENAITVSEGNLRNLTRTAGFITNFGKYSPLTTSYRDALSLAAMQVSTGATDYNTAIRNALKPFTDRGIVSITYDKDGKLRRRSIEAAVRQCVMQGARDMSKAYMQGVAEDIGADGREISAHLNCAPDHQDIQGKQYSNKKYEELNASLARPIGTLNCRHMAFPIILGVSEPAHSEQELQELKAENDKGVTYEGKHYTLYEASQQQRKLERSIRKTKRRLIVADELGDKDDFTAQSIRLRRLREYYNDFSNKCKLTKRRELMRIGENAKNNKNKFSKKENESIINNKAMYRSNSEFVYPPMDKELFEKIKRGCAKKGILILQDSEAQRNLDYFNVEAATLDANTILLRENPSASSVFEELIHVTQIRQGKYNGDYKNELLCEIEAKEKLIRNKRPYRISEIENIVTQKQLEEYKNELEKWRINNE